MQIANLIKRLFHERVVSSANFCKFCIKRVGRGILFVGKRRFLARNLKGYYNKQDKSIIPGKASPKQNFVFSVRALKFYAGIMFQPVDFVEKLNNVHMKMLLMKLKTFLRHRISKALLVSSRGTFSSLKENRLLWNSYEFTHWKAQRTRKLTLLNGFFEIVENEHELWRKQRMIIFIDSKDILW